MREDISCLCSFEVSISYLTYMSVSVYFMFFGHDSMLRINILILFLFARVHTKNLWVVLRLQGLMV